MNHLDDSELGIALSKILGSSDVSSSRQAPPVRKTIVDPKPRSDSIVSDDDEIKFKRVLTKYMEHELAREGGRR